MEGKKIRKNKKPCSRQRQGDPLNIIKFRSSDPKEKDFVSFEEPEEPIQHEYHSGSDDSEEEDDSPKEISIDENTEKKIMDKVQKLKEKNVEGGETGVLYLGRLPHGFFEPQMKDYFSQFGEISRLRLSRNKKTGRSKHYAFIEFQNHEVAEIVAETMHNYLMFGRLLQCKVVPKEKVHPKTFVGSNRSKFRIIPFRKIARTIREAPKSEAQTKKRSQRLKQKDEIKMKKLKELGIDYEFPKY